MIIIIEKYEDGDDEMNRKLLYPRNMAICSLFTALIAIGAFIQIPVPMNDYFTLQFFFVLLAGLLLGSRLGSLSVIIYVLIGLIGIPIFAAGGGLAYIVRPSFGYLLGFIVTAFMTGYICEKSTMTGLKKYALAIVVGLLCTYVIGIMYKYLILNYYVGEPISLTLVLLSCFPLDLPGDIFLSCVALLTAKRLEPMKGKWNL